MLWLGEPGEFRCDEVIRAMIPRIVVVIEDHLLPDRFGQRAQFGKEGMNRLRGIGQLNFVKVERRRRHQILMVVRIESCIS